MLDFIFRPFELLKGTAMPVHQTTVRKDGYTWRKVSATKWVRESKMKTPKIQNMDQWRKAQHHFDYAMTASLGNIVSEVLDANGIDSFEMLVEKIKAGEQALASNLYRQVVDQLRQDNSPIGHKKDTLDNFGRALLILKGEYSTAQKVKKTISHTAPGSGKTWYSYPEGKHSAELPTLKPTAIAAAKKKMGGWSITGTITSAMIQKMIKAKGAKLVMGKIDGRKPWVMPKKAEDMELKYKGTYLLLRVKQIVKKDQRTRATAKVEIKLPYAFAKSFLLHQIKSARTRNNFIFRMERSAGYRAYINKAGS